MTHHRVAACFLLLILVLIAVPLFLSGCSEQKEQAELNVQAWDFMARSVSARLENPDRLTFPPDSASTVTPLGENRFQITSFAEFTNAQGQQETAYFHGIVVYSNESWTLESLKFAE